MYGAGVPSFLVLLEHHQIVPESLTDNIRIFVVQAVFNSCSFAANRFLLPGKELAGELAQRLMCPLFGECGEAKLIVSVSFGTRALFKWKGNSCEDSDVSSCWLGDGDVLVMDGQCQDESLHCTDSGLEQERINVTFRRIRQNVASCPLLKDRSGVLFANVVRRVHPFCCGVCGERRLLGILGVTPRGPVHDGGVLAPLVCPFMSTGSGLRRCAYRWTRPVSGGPWRYYLRSLWEFVGFHSIMVGKLRRSSHVDVMLHVLAQ